jgi:DNA-binding NtrC family response regulator
VARPRGDVPRGAYEKQLVTSVAEVRDHQAAHDPTRFGSFVGRSPAVRRLYPLCSRLAAASVPLVIEGETGTGKEALAEAIHVAGTRASGPFVVFDCTTVPASLVEATLFGHERGAFTGADAAKPGIFEQANGGTLFVDEIGDLDLVLQSRLLRAIEKSQVQRIGSNRWLHVDVRIVAATRRDLDAIVADGLFRQDLFFRLAVARIELPPLRERPEDIELLARHFWPRHLPFPEHVLPLFATHLWPGNVRELGNTIARLAALGDLSGSTDDLFNRRTTPPPAEDEKSSAHSCTDFIDSVVAQGLSLAVARDLVMTEFERRYVEHLETSHRNDRSRAAASGISNRHLRTLRGRAREA